MTHAIIWDKLSTEDCETICLLAHVRKSIAYLYWKDIRRKDQMKLYSVNWVSVLADAEARKLQSQCEDKE